MQLYISRIVRRLGHPDFDDVVRFYVETSDTIDIVKALIFFPKGVPTEHQRLFFEGTELQDGCMLWEYGICPAAQGQSLVVLDCIHPLWVRPNLR